MGLPTGRGPETIHHGIELAAIQPRDQFDQAPLGAARIELRDAKRDAHRLGGASVQGWPIWR